MIGPEDPQPCRIINRNGKARVLLVGDHASNTIPAALDRLGLDDAALEQHIAYDIGTRALIEHLCQHLYAPAVVAGYSRLVVDLNRNLKDPSVMPEVSDGTVIRGNLNMSPEHRSQRIQHFYTPYRNAIDQMLAGFEDKQIIPALVSIHSFTPVMQGVSRPWHVGVLWDEDPRIAVPLIENLRAHPQTFDVGDNQPYSGREMADYTLDHHAEARGLPHVAIEVRQDLIGNIEGVVRWSRILAAALRDILADPKLYRLRACL